MWLLKYKNRTSKHLERFLLNPPEAFATRVCHYATRYWHQIDLVLPQENVTLHVSVFERKVTDLKLEIRLFKQSPSRNQPDVRKVDTVVTTFFVLPHSQPIGNQLQGPRALHYTGDVFGRDRAIGGIAPSVITKRSLCVLSRMGFWTYRLNQHRRSKH